MGGRSGQGVGSQGRAVGSGSLKQYEGIANEAIKEFGIKGEIKLTESKYGNDGYAKQDIGNYDNGESF